MNTDFAHRIILGMKNKYQNLSKDQDSLSQYLGGAIDALFIVGKINTQTKEELMRMFLLIEV